MRSHDRREVVAHHEAGHAVAAWRVGCLIESVAVAAEGGAVVIRGPWGLPLRERLNRNLLTLFAGPEAQRVFDPASDIERGAAEDYARADDVLVIGLGRDAGIAASIRRMAQREARAFVLHEWPVIAALARQLAERGRLDGPATVAAMRAAALSHRLAAGPWP